MMDIRNREPEPLTLLSFNLKRDSFPGSRNKWNNRGEMAAKLIRSSGADILGVQELLPGMREDLVRMLPEYAVIGSGRYLGVKPGNDEHSDIFVRKDKAEIMDYKTFWLSKHPEKAGSRGLLALFPRICTVAELCLRVSGRKIRVFNTHLDCVSSFARVVGVKTILSYMDYFNKAEKLPVILMGDMNAKPGSRAIQILREQKTGGKELALNDIYVSCSEGQIHNSLHRFRGKIKEGRQPIDYIFVSDDFDTVEYRICTEDYGGKYPSDHFPLMASVRL